MSWGGGEGGKGEDRAVGPEVGQPAAATARLQHRNHYCIPVDVVSDLVSEVGYESMAVSKYDGTADRVSRSI